MNAVPFLCPMALNLHQKRPSSVTFGRLFHRAIRREIAAPSSVLMGDGAAKLPPPSAIPPRNTTRKRKTIIRFDGDGAAKLPPSSVIPPRHATRNRSTIVRFDGDGAAKLPPSSVIPPHNTTRNCGAIIRFDDRWCCKVTPIIRHSATQYDAKSQHHHSFCWTMVQGNYPLGGYTFFNSPHPFPAFGNSVARRGSRLRVAFACIVGENSVKEKWTIDDFRHP